LLDLSESAVARQRFTNCLSRNPISASEKQEGRRAPCWCSRLTGRGWGEPGQ